MRCHQCGALLEMLNKRRDKVALEPDVAAFTVAGARADILCPNGCPVRTVRLGQFAIVRTKPPAATPVAADVACDRCGAPLAELRASLLRPAAGVTAIAVPGGRYDLFCGACGRCRSLRIEEIARRLFPDDDRG